VDAPVGVWIGVCRLTNAMFAIGVGNLIINISPIWWRFLLDIARANKIDIFIDYRAGFKINLTVFKMRAVVGI